MVLSYLVSDLDSPRPQDAILNSVRTEFMSAAQSMTLVYHDTTTVTSRRLMIAPPPPAANACQAVTSRDESIESCAA
jgi:hypothetical protein